MKEIKFFDAFAGIGGFHLATKNSFKEWKCVGYSETDKYCISNYNKNFIGSKNYGDITKLDPNKRVIKRMQELIAQDIPESVITIKSNGEIVYKN